MSGDDGLVAELEEFLSTAYPPAIALLKKEFPKRRSLLVDYVELEKWNTDIADLLLSQPDKVIPAAKEALALCGVAKTYDYEPHVRFVNLPDTGLLVQDIGAAHIDKLIRVEGVITKRAETKPKVKMATYKCSNCGAFYKLEITKGTKPMTVCDVCKKKIDFSEEESYFVDVQRADMQELLERLKGGAPASNIELMVEDDLVNTYNPGDNLIINGVLRIRPQMQKGKSENIYHKYIDVVSIEKMQKDFEQLEISEEEEEKIKEMGKDPEIIRKIASSIAPGIYGHEKIKEAICLQLFGGTRNKTLPGGAPVRNDVHLLLIGDPGAAKSRILQYVTDIAPKSVYVSGKSVSGVGLTASAEKDELGDGGWVLKAGALVLASGGIAAIDEFDKIDDKERAALHEAMEMQSVSVAKAGIVARFRTKTAIIAAANPKYGRFNPNQYPADQFDIPPTLLSRFDLIFPIYDVLDEEKDRELAKHILEPHAGVKSEEARIAQEQTIDKNLLRKYIAYARKNISPVLTREAMDRISDYYVEMRKLGRKEGTVPVTPRQIEGLIRLSEAAAKARLSNTVEKEDAERAIKLFDYALKQIAMDAATGKLDIDIITTGQPKARTERFALMLNIIKDLSSKYDMIDINEIKNAAREFNIDDSEAARIIEQLLDRGELYRPKHGFVKLLDKKG
ncbi:MAG: minichromosome maintenance protein MCM [Candidatus Micrarchaeota archaeon]|nr:minichromosome maintenance protein MCM [Candidatus Micrarchaeota archaeon]